MKKSVQLNLNKGNLCTVRFLRLYENQLWTIVERNASKFSKTYLQVDCLFLS